MKMVDPSSLGISSRPGWVAAGWLAVAVGLVFCAWRYPSTGEGSREVLPPDATDVRGKRVLAEAFPRVGGGSRAVVIVSRPDDPLGPMDEQFLLRAASALGRADVAGEWDVISPATMPERLRSADGHAAMIVVRVPGGIVSDAAVDAVDRMEKAVQSPESVESLKRPDGLSVELTGLPALARDTLAAATVSIHRTTWVTATALLVILLWVYRAPLAAGAVLGATALCVVVAMQLMTLVGHLGRQISPVDRTLAVVIIFGSGTDFGLFLVTRFREILARCGDRREAMRRAWSAVAPPITMSAATTIAGLLAMTLAEIRPIRNVGVCLAMATALTWLVSLTLVPAVALLPGRWLFWPSAARDGRSRLWLRVGWLVSRRPAWVLGVVLAAAAPMLWLYGRTALRYDTLLDAPRGSSAARGLALVDRHFGLGSAWPNSVLVRHERLTDPVRARAISRTLAERLGAVEGVSEVRGLHVERGGGLLERFTTAVKYTHLYHHAVAGTVRLAVVPRSKPLSLAAARQQRQIEAVTRKTLAEGGLPGAEAFFAGPSAYTLDVVEITGRDLRRICLAVTGVIGLLLCLTLRKVWLAGFLVLATVMVYAMAIASAGLVLSCWGDRPDWKVCLFAFVLLVAIGQDYNLFLVSRLFEERRLMPPGRAVMRGVARTGVVISNCGLIMAVTFGSLCTSPLILLRQVGLALALGILLDTFIVRPLAVPAFQLLRWRAAARRSA